MSASKRIRPPSTKTSERTLRGLVLVVMALVALWPTAAWAGTIGVPLTDGTLTVFFSNGPPAQNESLSARGPDFAISSATLPFGFSGPSCLSLCVPGSSFAASTREDFADFGGVTYDGVSQAINAPAFSGEARASWTVTAGSILMPPIGDPFTVTTPFLLDLEVRLADCATCDSRSRVIRAAGAGDATLSFAPAPGGREWWPTSVVYDITIPINPVPEPSTWLLVPTAVGLAWLAHKKAKTAQTMPCRAYGLKIGQ